MALVVAPSEVGHAAAAIGRGVVGGAPLEVAGKEEPLLAEVVTAAAEADGPPAAIVGATGGGGPLEVARKEEERPAEGKLAVGADGKGAGAPAEVEGAPEAITAEGAPGEIKAEGDEKLDDDVGDGTVEAKGAAAVEEDEEEEEEEKWLKHYSSLHRILTVGDGDFSFSLALATAFGSGANLVATSLDTYEVVRGKYSKAESNIMEVKRLGATVLHGVDAKTMVFHTDLKNKRFDRIVFNFPHAGFKGKEDDLHLINMHKELMWYFFYNACRLLRRYGEIHVTHKTGGPYDRWDLERLASECSLALIMKVDFQKEDYPGYNQKRGDSARCDEPFHIATACTFMFQIGDLKKLKKINRNRAGSISNLGGSNVHHGQWVTDTGSFHLLPPAGAWPPQPGQWTTEREPFHPLPPSGAWPPQPGQLTTDRGPFYPLPPVEPWPPQHFPPLVNADNMPLHPYIADERQQPCFPLNSDGIMGDPYFHEHDSFRPMLSMPGPSLNYLPAPDDIPPPMGRIPCPNFLPPLEQTWYHPRTISDPPESDDYSYFTREYQRSLQREYGMRRHLMPGSTSSNYSAFLEHRHMESVKKQEWLRSMIALYGRQ
ncbi:hypothetical protein EJB05_43455, partial [Eragrostis curvula]